MKILVRLGAVTLALAGLLVRIFVDGMAFIDKMHWSSWNGRLRRGRVNPRHLMQGAGEPS